MKIRLSGFAASKFDPFTIPGLLFAGDDGGGGGGDKDADADADDDKDADADTDGDKDALGDAGKKALDAMKGQRNAARGELRAFKALGLTPSQITALTVKPDAEKPDVAAIQHTADVAAQTKANGRIIRSEVKAAAAGKMTDPADAYKFLDLTKFEVDDDGNVDEADIAEAIDDLVKKKPYLAAQGKRFQGQGDGGTRNENRPSQLTNADLAAMSADEVVKARKDGRLNDLMGIKS